MTIPDLSPAPSVRAALDDCLPKALAPVMTWLTGEARPGSDPGRRTQTGRVAGAFLAYDAGLLGSVSAVALAGPAAAAILPLTWTLMVGAARDLQLTILHHSAHGTVISKEWSPRIGRAIATVLVIEPFDSYAPKHQREHHGRHSVSTKLDPTVLFLLDIGIEPGASKAQNRRRFLKALVSPRRHARMLWRRLVDQFGPKASWANRLATGSYLAVLGGGTVALAGWPALLLGVVLPMTVGYQAAQIARLIVEHRWPAAAPADGKRSQPEHDALTVSIRCAVAPPQTDELGARLRFAAAMLFNAWIRWTVLPGDSGPNHHWHHGEARGDWANHVAAAADWTARRRAKDPDFEVIEAWGYGAALDLALQSFEAASLASLAGPAQFGGRTA